MKKILKWTAIVIGALILIGILLPDKESSKGETPSSSAEQSQPVTETKAKSWKEVFTFKGHDMKKSANFHLSGGNARIRYKYKAGEYGGLFGVYVVEKGVDIMNEGGFPEVMIQETEESESYIQKDAGDYYLNVNAQGAWDIVVEEEI